MTDPMMAYEAAGDAYRLTDGELAQRVDGFGLCRDQGTDEWSPDEPAKGRADEREAYEANARRACQGCPVLPECVLLALRYESGYGVKAHGIWGGTAPWEREKLARRLRRRGLPLRIVDELTGVAS